MKILVRATFEVELTDSVDLDNVEGMHLDVPNGTRVTQHGQTIGKALSYTAEMIDEWDNCEDCEIAPHNTEIIRNYN